MILYFRANITYDYSRVGYDDISIDYALAPFANTTPLRGIYEYKQFELPAHYDENQARALAEKMLSAFYSDSTPLSVAFEKIIKR